MRIQLSMTPTSIRIHGPSADWLTEIQLAETQANI
jgi:hypothetical protein